jgi:hypothetical protein
MNRQWAADIERRLGAAEMKLAGGSEDEGARETEIGRLREDQTATARVLVELRSELRELKLALQLLRTGKKV